MTARGETSRIQLNCDQCGKDILVWQWKLKAHIRHFCDRDCAQTWQAAEREAKRQQRIRPCEGCGEDFLPPRDSYKFCSRKCADANHPKRPLQRVTAVCETCKVEFEVHPYRADTARFCSPSCHGIWRTMNTPRISSIEIVVSEELDRRNLLFDQQIRVGPFVPDFIVGDTIIEVDGDYWHNLPGVAERDIRKNMFYEESGFNLIRIWEHEIKAGDFSKIDALCGRT